MLDQPSFADLDYQHKRHKTRREQFLERLGAWVPWSPGPGWKRGSFPTIPRLGRGAGPIPCR